VPRASARFPVPLVIRMPDDCALPPAARKKVRCFCDGAHDVATASACSTMRCSPAPMPRHHMRLPMICCRHAPKMPLIRVPYDAISLRCLSASACAARVMREVMPRAAVRSQMRPSRSERAQPCSDGLRFARAERMLIRHTFCSSHTAGDAVDITSPARLLPDLCAPCTPPPQLDAMP